MKYFESDFDSKNVLCWRSIYWMVCSNTGKYLLYKKAQNIVVESYQMPENTQVSKIQHFIRNFRKIDSDEKQTRSIYDAFTILTSAK